MQNYSRLLKIKLPAQQSAFLWGARKTGKSTFLKNHFPNSVYYDLLKSDLYLKFVKEPHLFREELLALTKDEQKNPVIVDEIQKIPILLDEVHWLIENAKLRFILCGSSARKLKREGVNLLGGRAWKYHFYPLVFPEIIDFDLLKVLNRGTVPSHYNSQDIKKSLRAYIEDYLTQEIQTEGLVRNLPAFARFLDSIAFTNGGMVNYANVARDCGVDAKTVKEYYQILVDTLLGYNVFPFKKKSGRRTITSIPKFYLFDVGVAGGLSKRELSLLKGTEAGAAFENYILQELVAFRGLNDLDFDISYWRTRTGLEVDFILGNKVAIEVKINENIRSSDLTGLKAFLEEHTFKKAIVVCLTPRPRKIMLPNNNSIDILPVDKFLQQLWGKKLYI